MRIAISHTRYSRSGGIEAYIAGLVDRLLEDGHEVHCFVRRWEPQEHPHLHFHHVPVLPLGEGLKALTFAYASAWLLGRERFDIVHGFSKTFLQDVYTDGSGCFDDYAVYLRGAPLWRRVVTFRPLLAWAIRHIERRRFAACPPPRVLAMSSETRDQILRRHPFPCEHVQVVHSGVDTRRFRPLLDRESKKRLRASLGVPEGSLLLLLVGNDFRRKGVDTALRAAARLDQAGRSVALWVLGHDRRGHEYGRQAQALRAPARFLGSSPDPLPYLQAADIFLFPSRYDVFGNAALEAMATGLPCVVSRRAGVSEIVTPGLNALVLEDPESPQELEHLVARLASPVERERLGMAARGTAEKYSLSSHHAQVIESYEGLARRPRKWQPAPPAGLPSGTGV